MTQPDKFFYLVCIEPVATREKNEEQLYEAINGWVGRGEEVRLIMKGIYVVERSTRESPYQVEAELFAKAQSLAGEGDFLVLPLGVLAKFPGRHFFNKGD